MDYIYALIEGEAREPVGAYTFTASERRDALNILEIIRGDYKQSRQTLSPEETIELACTSRGEVREYLRDLRENPQKRYLLYWAAKAALLPKQVVFN